MDHFVEAGGTISMKMNKIEPAKANVFQGLSKYLVLLMCDTISFQKT